MAPHHKEPNIPPIQQGSVLRDFLIGVVAGLVVAIVVAAVVPQHAHTHVECPVENKAD